MKKKTIILLMAALCMLPIWADKKFEVSSPDGSLKVEVNVGKNVTYAIQKNGQSLLTNSPISMEN